MHALTRVNFPAFSCSKVDKAEEGWTGPTGHVNASLIEAHLPKPSEDSVIFVCGPPGMMNVSGEIEQQW